LEITRKISRKLYWFITNIQKSQEKLKISSSLLQAFGNPKKKMKVNVFDGSPLALKIPRKKWKEALLVHHHHFYATYTTKTLTLLMSFNIGKVRV
jgi:hypothetical protein